MQFRFIDGYNEKYKIYENGDIFMNDIKMESFKHKRTSLFRKI